MSETYQTIREIIPSGNPYAFQKLKEKFGSSDDLITELCNFIKNPDEAVVDKADAIEVLGFLSITDELTPKVIKTLYRAIDEANKQSKDDMHPIKTEAKKVLAKLKQ